MSYSIDLRDKDTNGIVKAPPHTGGGTYCISGTDEASMDVTYNYGGMFYAFIDKESGIRWLYGKTGRECRRRLRSAIRRLEALDGSGPFKDYWAPTPGNAAHALKILLDWATRFPDAVFSGD